MFKVDIKYCPWALSTDSKTWEVLKSDIVSEEDALAYANKVAMEHSQCTIRVTNEDDAYYETTIES